MLAAKLRHKEECLELVNQWMSSNHVCMKNNKIEYLPVVPKIAAALVDDSVIGIGDVVITASKYVHNTQKAE